MGQNGLMATVLDIVHPKGKGKGNVRLPEISDKTIIDCCSWTSIGHMHLPNDIHSMQN